MPGWSDFHSTPQEISPSRFPGVNSYICSMKRLLLLITFITTITFITNSQVVYEPVTSNPVYQLLDELAALKVITINSAVKPYSRVFIANKLNQALEKGDKLNKRQLEEVRFYLSLRIHHVISNKRN